MKKLLNLNLITLAISSAACATLTQPTSQAGRIIEFKSDSNGFDTKTFFYEGQQEVIAFDAQFTPELAQAAIDYLRTFTKKPITWLVITHPNPDKFNGASVFKKEGSQIISSQSTALAIPEAHSYKEFYFVEIAKMFQKGQYPQPVPVDRIFKGKMELVLNDGEKIVLQELSKPGISSTQTVAYVKNAKALFVGDLVHHKAHAWLEGGIVNGKPKPTLNSWIEDLKEIEAYYSPNTLIYGGRGQVVSLSEAVPSQIRYLEMTKKLVNKELKKLGSKAAEFNGPNSGAMYKALTQKFQEAFPNYELPYMIEYGIYGLVQSEMKSSK